MTSYDAAWARLKELQALADDASPGPWVAYNANRSTDYLPLWAVANEAFFNPGEEDDSWIAVEVHVGTKTDADLIAGMRNAWVAILAAVEERLKRHHPKPCPEGCDDHLVCNDRPFEHWPCADIAGDIAWLWQVKS